MPIGVVSRWLVDKQGYQEEEAHLLASLSEGSIGKAMEIREGIREIPREELLQNWVGVKKLSFEKIEHWTESLPSQRESLLLILEVVRTLLRDLVMVNLFKHQARLIHTDLLREMERIASQWRLSSLLERMRALHQTILAIRGNANTALALEAMMFSWAEG